MGLRLKFNLVLVVVFVRGGLIGIAAAFGRAVAGRLGRG